MLMVKQLSMRKRNLDDRHLHSFGNLERCEVFCFADIYICPDILVGPTTIWYVSLPVLNTMLRFPGSQVLTFVILTKSSQCLLALLLCSAMVSFSFSNCVYMHAHVAF